MVKPGVPKAERMSKMDEKRMPHNVIMENKQKISVSQVEDVDTFDEGKIVLYTADDTMIIEGYDLHIQKLDVAGGEMVITGEIVSLMYTGRNGEKSGGKGFFKRMLK